MRHYSNSYSSNSSWTEIIIILILLIILITGFNSCSEATWNNGYCPDCEIRYELRGASRGLKYYACPECGQEVERY